MLPSQARTWYDRDPVRWTEEQVAVHRRFPHFCWGERLHPNRHRFWRGCVQPFPTLEHLDDVAGHLMAQEPIEPMADGQLVVEPPTAATNPVPHHPALSTQFLIELVYLEPPAIPRVYALHPRIDIRSFPQHTHLNGWQSGRPHPLYPSTGFAPFNDLCIFAAFDGIWSWDTNTAEDILAWTALWLGAHLIWIAQGRGTNDWPVPSAPHSIAEILTEVAPSQPCPCGSAEPFGSCCRETYLRASGGPRDAA